MCTRATHTKKSTRFVMEWVPTSVCLCVCVSAYNVRYRYICTHMSIDVCTFMYTARPALGCKPNKAQKLLIAAQQPGYCRCDAFGVEGLGFRADISKVEVRVWVWGLGQIISKVGCPLQTGFRSCRVLLLQFAMKIPSLPLSRIAQSP